MSADDGAADEVLIRGDAISQVGSVESDEVNRRVLDTLDVVAVVAREVSRSIDDRVHFDELVAAGRAGLFEAACRFDPKRGASFRTYANYRVEGAIIDTVRRSLQLPRRAYQRLGASGAASWMDGGEYSQQVRDAARWRLTKSHEDILGDELSTMATAGAASIELSSSDTEPKHLATPEEDYERAELVAQVQAAIDELSEYEARAIRLHYFEEKSHEEAALAMNVSKAWAHRLYTRAMAKLTRRFR